MGRNKILKCFMLLIFGIPLNIGAQSMMNFSNASIILLAEDNGTENVAVEMLIDEVSRRSKIEFSVDNNFSTIEKPLIVVGKKEVLASVKELDMKSIPGMDNTVADGFSIGVIQGDSHPILVIAGNDNRGVLFGCGYLLRKSNLSEGLIDIPENIVISTNPVVPLRGHQLGYRPKVNSYDGFTVDMWEQYIKDLVVFGTNAVELMPPNTDDASNSPMFTLPQDEMLVKMSSLLKKYGLDVWMWYPLMHGDYKKTSVVGRSLRENDSIFSSMPKLDAVFIPGGDPGRQEPSVLFEHLERKAKVLHKYHPDAEIWVSPQGYSAEWMDEFIEILKGNPEWLTGIVHGPWVRMDVNDLREVVPEKYPIRRYPDITHSIDAQYFVPDWDYAYTVTENRETINPRPEDHKTIFNSVPVENYKGFISYSEGVNDDVNKIIWSGLGWNPEADVLEILRDYSRYFIGPHYADVFAQSILNLEKNWQGDLSSNDLVNVHHAIFHEMEKKANPSTLLNWRFQLALYRSYYDIYTRNRLLYENHLEGRVMDVLRRAGEIGSELSIQKSRRILEKAVLYGVSEDLKSRLFELAEALFQSIRMQLSVEKYHAIDVVRGANLDLVDYPLNNRYWLEKQFDRIENIDSEEERLAGIHEILNWTNPGPGGFYDDLGDPENQPHMIANLDYEKDPNSFKSAFAGLPGGYSLEFDRIKDWRVSWKTYMQTIFEQPLQMRYTGLDPHANYQVKVVYVEDQEIRLKADDKYMVHDYLLPDYDPKPVIFDVPVEATKDGTLELEWNIHPGGMGPGRGCSVAEVWLVRK